MKPSEQPKKPKCRDCLVHQSIVQSVEVVGPMAMRNEVLDLLFNDGFRITASGPYTNKKISPRVDMTRFLIMAEKKI